MLPNRPLQQPNATNGRPDVGHCRDAAGCARDSSRPWYDRRRPWRSLLNGRSFGSLSGPMTMERKLMRVVATALALSLWCSLPSVQAAPDAGVGVYRTESIDERIAEIVSQSPGFRGGGWDDELWENKSMQEIVHNPTRYGNDIEEYLLTRSRDKDDETLVAMLALQCLPLERYTKFVKRLATAEKETINSHVLLYSIVPGNEWSTRLARKYRDPGVKDSLTLARQSPNADDKVRTLIDHILAGNYAYPKHEALLKCDAGR
jgi:hypothetical protein